MFRPTYLVSNNWNCLLVIANFYLVLAHGVFGEIELQFVVVIQNYSLIIQKQRAIYWCGPGCSGLYNGRVEMTKNHIGREIATLASKIIFGKATRPGT